MLLWMTRRTVTPALTTERLRLDPLAVADAPEMTAVLADQRLYTFVGGEPPSVAAVERQYRSWLAGPRLDDEAWLNWIVRLRASGEAIGHAQATWMKRSGAADIAWVIGTRWQRRGYATEAAQAVIDWLESQGVATITAHVHPDHIASARAAERAGLHRTDVAEGGEIVWRRVLATREN